MLTIKERYKPSKKPLQRETHQHQAVLQVPWNLLHLQNLRDFMCAINLTQRTQTRVGKLIETMIGPKTEENDGNGFNSL